MSFNQFVNKKISLRCIGVDPAVGSYLNGHTTKGTVDLCPNTGKDYTGSGWLVNSSENELYTFECLGNQPNVNYAFLAGDTTKASVYLASTGTRFQAVELDPINYIYSLQVASQGEYTYLNGVPPNFVNLAGSSTSYTTYWQVKLK